MWISQRKYEEMVQKLEDSDANAKYWKESFEEMYDKYLTVLMLMKKQQLTNKM